jgi:hypothetical protein
MKKSKNAELDQFGDIIQTPSGEKYSKKILLAEAGKNHIVFRRRPNGTMVEFTGTKKARKTG